jgi:hypothetical protein
MPITFRSHVQQMPGMKATGIPVPNEIIELLGGSKRPAVSVSLGSFSYQTTVAKMGHGFIFPLSAERRAASGLNPDDVIDVTIELDTAPRTVGVPADVATALATADLRTAFDALSPSRQKAHVTRVEGTKNPETRARRVAAVITSLAGE